MVFLKRSQIVIAGMLCTTADGSELWPKTAPNDQSYQSLKNWLPHSPEKHMIYHILPFFHVAFHTGRIPGPSSNDRPKLVTTLQRLSISLKVHRLLATVPSLECHLSCNAGSGCPGCELVTYFVKGDSNHGLVESGYLT